MIACRSPNTDSDLQGKFRPTRRIFELSLGMVLAALVCACSGTSTLSSPRVVGSYPLSYAAQPTSLAVGLGSLWVVVPEAGSPPAGQLAYGSLVRIGPETGKRQGAAIQVGGEPVDVAVISSSIWVANEGQDPREGAGYPDSVLDLAPATGTIVRAYGRQELASGPIETPITGDASGVWDIVMSSPSNTSETQVLRLSGPAAKLISTVSGLPASIAACDSGLYVDTTLVPSGRERLYRLSPNSGAVESTWTIGFSALASLDCLPRGVLLGLSSPKQGGLFRVEGGSVRVSAVFGARTQWGTAVIGDEVWTLTARQAADGNWSTWLYGYSWRSQRLIARPLRLGSTGDVLGPIAPAALAASGHRLWAVVGRRILKISI